MKKKLTSQNRTLNAYLIIPGYVLVIYWVFFAVVTWGNWEIVSNALFGAAVFCVNVSWVSLMRNLKKEKDESKKKKDRIGIALLLFSGYSILVSFLTGFMVS